jgi:hypothetical protein
MNYQARLIPFKRGDLTTLAELLPGDVFYYPKKQGEAFECLNFTVDKWGEITGCLVKERNYSEREKIIKDPATVTVVYLRNTEDLC